MERASSSGQDDRSNASDRGSDRSGEPRCGEGSQSALANLKRIEQDRERTRPADDRGDSRR